MNQNESPRRPDPDEAVRAQGEPWESWETRLCLWSLGIGIAALAVLGTLINIYLL